MFWMCVFMALYAILGVVVIVGFLLFVFEDELKHFAELLRERR